MDADYSVELGADDPVLDFPWSDPDGRVRYYDLKQNPELLEQLEEAREFRELAEFLRSINGPRSLFESAKCDAWISDEIHPEEDIFRARHKMSAYIDFVFAEAKQRFSLAAHESFARQLVELLRRAPETRSSVETIVRRCFFAGTGDPQAGFYFTLYVNGFGDDKDEARKSWGIAMTLVATAIGQLARASL